MLLLALSHGIAVTQEKRQFSKESGPLLQKTISQSHIFLFISEL